MTHLTTLQTKKSCPAAIRSMRPSGVGNLSYWYAIPLNRFILSPGGGILLGGEQCDRFSEQSNIIPYKNRFVYGLFIGCGAEYILGRHLSFYIAPRMNCLMKTNFEELRLIGTAGMRVYF